MTTFAKLQDGNWGIRGEGLVAGAKVTVTKKDGSTKVVEVGAIVWTAPDGKVSLATVAGGAKPASSSGGGAAYRHAPRASYRRNDGGCQACMDNEDMGDMNGCRLHRGNPRT